MPLRSIAKPRKKLARELVVHGESGPTFTRVPMGRGSSWWVGLDRVTLIAEAEARFASMPTSRMIVNTRGILEPE